MRGNLSFKGLCFENREPCVRLPVKTSRLMSRSEKYKGISRIDRVFERSKGEGWPTLHSITRPGVRKSIIRSPVQLPASPSSESSELPQSNACQRAKLSAEIIASFAFRSFVREHFFSQQSQRRMLSTHLHFLAYVSAGIDVLRPKLATAMVASSFN